MSPSILPLALLALSILTPTPSAARLGHPLNARTGGAGHLPLAAKRASHPASPNMDALRRSGTEAMERREGLVPVPESALKKKSKVGRKAKKSTKGRKVTKKDKDGKRLVRKRKAASCIPQVGFNVSTDATVSTSAITSTLASLPSSAVSSAYESAVPTASVTLSADPSGITTASSFAENFATSGQVYTSSSSSSAAAWSASSSSSASPTSATSSSAAAAPSSTSSWQLVEKWSGSSFFDHWDFWNYDDPTHGTVVYVDSSTAWNDGLVSINSAGNAIIDVDKTQHVSGGRKSVRLHGHKVFTGGLVLFDAVHAPTGCGTWPAWWSNGPNWPYGGEIDIMEGINTFGQNQVSLHTGAGCTMPNDLNMKGSLTTGSYNSYDCASYNTANQGCGVRDATADNAYGAGFNSAGGGVYALEWAKTGINAWFFTRSAIPADITSGSPDSSNWGTPVANFPSDNCDPYTFFYDHFNIIDTTFCGDWAGASSVWNYAGYAGQDTSCAASTGYSTCSDYVVNEGSKFTEAYWEIKYVSYYNSTTLV